MNVILSIKPEFVEKIFSGEKQYEYRKVLFKQKVDTVYIYASRPISKIVGEFKIEKILCDTAANVYIQDMAHLVAINKKYAGFTFYPVYVMDIAKLYIVE